MPIDSLVASIQLLAVSRSLVSKARIIGEFTITDSLRCDVRNQRPRAMNQSRAQQVRCEVLL